MWSRKTSWLQPQVSSAVSTGQHTSKHPQNMVTPSLSVNDNKVGSCWGRQFNTSVCLLHTITQVSALILRYMEAHTCTCKCHKSNRMQRAKPSKRPYTGKSGRPDNGKNESCCIASGGSSFMLFISSGKQKKGVHSPGLGESLRISALSCFHGFYTWRLWGFSNAAPSLNPGGRLQTQSPEHTVLVRLEGENLLCLVKTVVSSLIRQSPQISSHRVGLETVSVGSSYATLNQ